MVYKIHFTQCHFVSLWPNSKIIKHPNYGAQKGSGSFDQNSKVANHVHHFSHNMNFEEVKLVGFRANYYERLFLEAWHSTLDPNSGNDHSRSLQRNRANMNYVYTWSRLYALRYVTL